MPLSSKTTSRALSLTLLCLAILFAAWNIPLQTSTSIAAPSASVKILDAYAKLPLSFEVNRGQAGSDFQFLSRGHGLAVFLGSTGATFLTARTDLQSTSPQPDSPAAQLSIVMPSLLAATSLDSSNAGSGRASNLFRMSLIGARYGSQAVGVDPLPGKANYFLGDDPKNWQTNLETFAKVKYQDVYPGIDLLYYGNQQRLEYDFIIAPGSSPQQIRLALDGVDQASIDPTNGDLVLGSGSSELRFQKPSIYQDSGDSLASGASGRSSVEGGYVLEAGNRIGFHVGSYDSSKPLVIDPVLSFYTYLGGMLPDVALHVAADASGVYVTGATASPDFPHSASAFSTTLKVGTCGPPTTNTLSPCPDVFVTKLKLDGTGILYSTYLGGSRSDFGIGIAVDSNQQAYIVGETESFDFPTTTSGFQSSASSTTQLARAFLTKLNSTGSQLLYSTFLGGTLGSRGVGNDQVNDTGATAVAVDSAGHAYVAGYTRSNSLPTTAGVVQHNAGGNSGAGGIQCHSIGSGRVIPCSDGFIAKFDTGATGAGSLIYATYLGGSYYDAVTGIAIDSDGSAYVVGATLSDDFPVAAAFQATRKPGRCGPFSSGTFGGHVCSSAFVAKLDTTAATLVYSSYLGGTGDTAALGVAVDPSKNAYLTGVTNSADFPATAGVVQHALAAATCSLAGKSIPCPDAFAAKISSTGSLSYATFLGGTGLDIGFGIAVDSSGNAYVAGLTNSTNFPTASPAQPAFGSGNCPVRISGTSFNVTCPDAFLTKLDPAGANLVYSTYVGGTNVDFATGVALDPSNNVYVTGGTLSGGLATQGVFQSVLGSKGDAFVFKVAAPAATPPFRLLPDTAAGSTSATVSDGQTATYKLQVTPSGGFTGTITFSCTGAPAHATCTPPASVVVNSNAAVPFTVTVSTMAPAVAPPVLRRIPDTRVPLWPFAYLALVFVLLAARNRLRFSRVCIPLLCTAALFLACLPFLAGCGNNQTVVNNTGTPLGTTTLVLTGTSGATQQTLNLSLTVQ